LTGFEIRDESDADLVRRSQAGDKAAFVEIVERYKNRIHLMVRRMVRSPEDEDITQEVFLRAFQALPLLRSGGALRTWLFRIAHNLCITEIQRRDARGDHLSLDDESEEALHRHLPCAPSGLEQEIEKKDFADAVVALIAKLPPSYRAVLTLHYVEGAKYEEIAEITGAPLGTIKTHIRRAKLRLRNLVLTELDRTDMPGIARKP
jgi:RNA polymerase sigma-70 factor (ECF subfamily)